MVDDTPDHAADPVRDALRALESDPVATDDARATVVGRARRRWVRRRIITGSAAAAIAAIAAVAAFTITAGDDATTPVDVGPAATTAPSTTTGVDDDCDEAPDEAGSGRIPFYVTERVWFDGAAYSPVEVSAEADVVLGEQVGRVCRTLASSGNRDRDVDATALPVGTELRVVVGYGTWFRLGAEVDGAVRVYQLVEPRADAASGRDVLDLSVGVDAVESRAAQDEAATDLRSIEAPGTVQTVVDAVLDAPVIDDYRFPSSWRFESDELDLRGVTFFLADGTDVALRWVGTDDVITNHERGWALATPPELGDLLRSVAARDLPTTAYEVVVEVEPPLRDVLAALDAHGGHALLNDLAVALERALPAGGPELGPIFDDIDPPQIDLHHDGFRDDSVAGADYRLTLEQRDDGWHVDTVERRWVCRRGVSGDVCL